MYIAIAGDTVPTPNNQLFFEDSRINELIDEGVARIFSNASYRLLNLETPLTDVVNPICKNGPNLVASTKSINGFKQLGIDFVTLANNHIMDQGKDGLLSTIEILTKNGIKYGGVGDNLASSKASFGCEINGESYYFYCCTEHEFSVATDNKCGANPFLLPDSLEDIKKLKTEYDYVVVLYHGGKEHYRYPSNELRRNCHLLAKSGADLIICQHSHCIGSEEYFLNSKIVYGQGNFIFDSQRNDFWNTGLLILVYEKCKIDYVPIKNENGIIKLVTGTNKDILLDSFYKRSREINSQIFLNNEYAKLAESMLYEYGFVLSGYSGKSLKALLGRAINKLTRYKFQELLFKRRDINNVASILNFVECEAHRELLITGLKQYIERKEKK